MLNDFTHCVSTCFVFGQDAETQVGQRLAGEGIKKVLLCRSSDSFLTETGLLGRVTDALKAHGIGWETLDGIVPNPRLARVRDGIALARQTAVDAVLAVGGGSVIDTAKAVAAGVKYSGDVWDFFCGRATVQAALPVDVVLTVAATGSESGTVSMINNEEAHAKGMASSEHLRPRYAFMNPQLTCSLPPFVTACGIADMFSHAMERYFNSEDELNCIDYMAEGVMAAIVHFGWLCMRQPQSYAYRAEVMWLGTVAHNNTIGVGRPQDWSVHNIANELSALYDTPHGASLTILTPAWMEYVYRRHLWRFARFARAVFAVQQEDDEAAARAGIAHTLAFFKALGLPTSLEEAKIPTDRIDDMAEVASRAYGSDVIGSLMPLHKADIVTIFKNATPRR